MYKKVIRKEYSCTDGACILVVDSDGKDINVGDFIVYRALECEIKLLVLFLRQDGGGIGLKAYPNDDIDSMVSEGDYIGIVKRDEYEKNKLQEKTLMANIDKLSEKFFHDIISMGMCGTYVNGKTGEMRTLTFEECLEAEKAAKEENQ